MGQFVNLERPWSFFDASGNKYWSGIMLTGKVIEVYNAEASTTIAAGEAVIVDEATSVWSRWDLAATADAPKQVVGAKRVAAAASVGFIGVAGENIPAGKIGRVFGRGTWAAVKCITGLTSNAVGAHATGSATAGSIDTVTAAALVPGRRLGTVLISRTATGIGGTTYVGVDINPA